MTKKEIIYDLMTGQLDLAVFCPDECAVVENECVPGRAVFELYSAVAAARLRLADRLSTDLEDPDVLEIVEDYERICRILCLKMYDYAKRL